VRTKKDQKVSKFIGDLSPHSIEAPRKITSTLTRDLQPLPAKNTSLCRQPTGHLESNSRQKNGQPNQRSWLARLATRTNWPRRPVQVAPGVQELDPGISQNTQSIAAGAAARANR
jgi:hypothetical protein